MRITSAQASKLLKQLNEQLADLTEKEEYTREFCAASIEDPESLRPEYDYSKVQSDMSDLEFRIRKLRHSINVFNATTEVPGFDMTIDEMLVYIPQLTKNKLKLSGMKSKLPKRRVELKFGRPANYVDYTYLNYDLSEVEADYEKVSQELTEAQLALDQVNGSVEFDC